VPRGIGILPMLPAEDSSLDLELLPAGDTGGDARATCHRHPADVAGRKIQVLILNCCPPATRAGRPCHTAYGHSVLFRVATGLKRS
jgi:hypothetical protein